MLERLVVTGMGVIAPGASGVPELEVALRVGRSGVCFWPEAAALGLGCQVGGIPTINSQLLDDILPPPRRRVLSPILEYTALECWRDSGLSFDFEATGQVDWDTVRGWHRHRCYRSSNPCRGPER